MQKESECLSLKQNRQMYHVVMYDIQDDKLRMQLTKILEQKGLVRIQMSVFIGLIERNILKILEEEIENKIKRKCVLSDKLLILQVSQEALEKAHWFGENHEIIDEIIGNVNELFF